jgi:alkylation response protein AidB-like acyl-CoA dehydrogenase
VSQSLNAIDLVPDSLETDTKPENLRNFLEQLVSAGFIDSGLSHSEAPISQSGRLISDLAAKCLSSAFVTWSHRMTSEYVDRFGTSWLRENRLPELLDGSRVGSTALATALADRSGKELLPITFKQVGDSYLIDGVIPWASNLYPDTLVIFAAREPETGERKLFATELSFSGVSVKPAEGLLALNATASGTVRFQGLELSADYAFDAPVDEFFSRMRPRFLLLQSAFCLGLTKASLEAASAAASAAPFAEEIALLQAQFDQLESTWSNLLERQQSFEALPASQDPLPYLEVRLAAALLAQAVSRVELASVGGRGYFVANPTSRRVRESLFLSVQAPTEGSLRWEISQLKSRA